MCLATAQTTTPGPSDAPPPAPCMAPHRHAAGYVSTNALLLGKEQGLTTRDITLAAGEFFNQVQIKGAR